MYNRRDILKGACLGSATLLGLTGPLGRAHGASKRPPNILLVLKDQEAYPWHVPYQKLNLPNLLALKNRGVSFQRHFCTSPQCSPSRASIFTGLYPHQAGVVSNMGKLVEEGVTQGDLDAGDPNLTTVAHVLRDHGYVTAYRGKWHLCEDPDEAKMDAYGFDDFEKSDQDSGMLADAAMAVSAGAWVRQMQDEQPKQPWFLVVSFLNPHDIYTPRAYPERVRQIRKSVLIPESFFDDLANKPFPQADYLSRIQESLEKMEIYNGFQGEDWWKTYLSFYCSLLEVTDRGLGTVLQEVDVDRTVIIYTSDHGDMGAAHGLPFKLPAMYRELRGVPMVIAYPDSVKKSVYALTSHLDLVPTLCGFAGATCPEGRPGSDFRQLLQNPNTVWRTNIFMEYNGINKIVSPIRSIFRKVGDPRYTGNWVYNEYVNHDEQELYFLKNDPLEMDNLAGNPEYRELENFLKEQLTNWRVRTNDPLL